MSKKIILCFTIISLLASCKYFNNASIKDSDTEQITQIIDKYPELGQDTIGNYKLIRTIIIGEKKIGVKLYTCRHLYNTPNNIIIINNSAGQKYAIPLFSNNFRKFWSFENEEKTFKDKVYNSLFEKEYIQALNKLNLNDTLGTGYTILSEIFISLFHFQVVTEHDDESLKELSSNLVTSYFNNDKDFESELRNKLNYNQVLSAITKNEYIRNYNSLLDKKNYRIFQVDFPTKTNKKIQKLKIKIYRFGHEVINLEL